MKSFNRNKNVKFFTLMELTIVLAISAIIAGGALAAFEGMQKTAAQGTAAKDIATISSAVRNYTALEKAAPNDLDSLIAADYAAVGPLSNAVNMEIMPSKLSGKLAPVVLSAEQVDALNAAGITNARYLDAIGNETAAGTYTLAAPDASGATGTSTVGSISEIDIPNRAFDLAREGDKNRGRGFSHAFTTGDTLLALDATKVENNQKLGAADSDVLIALGLGNNASIVGNARVGLDGAPTYGNVEKNEYSRYILLYNVGPAGSEFSTAKLQAVVDTRGDFLDEEIAEFSGQKL